MTHIEPLKYEFHPVMELPEGAPVLDLRTCSDTGFIRDMEWAVGRYDEKREGMYLAPQYGGRRNIHMGIDLWTRSGAPVYACAGGEIAYLADHDQQGNYGPTIVTCHRLDGGAVPGGQAVREPLTMYALHGHLARSSLEQWRVGDSFEKGALLARIGDEEENGGWVPHLHFQLSREDPGEADMPGVVSEEEHEEALSRYPDPRLVLGAIY